MQNNESARGDRGNPLGLDKRDPEGIARFGLFIGYDEDNVVKSLVEQCGLDSATARRIVQDVASR